MTKSSIIIHIQKVAGILRGKSLCPGLYELPSQSAMSRATKKELQELLNSLDVSLTLRERVDKMEGVTFVDNYAKIRFMSNDYPHYIGRNGRLYENVGIGYTFKREATDADLTTFPILI